MMEEECDVGEYLGMGSCGGEGPLDIEECEEFYEASKFTCVVCILVWEEDIGVMGGDGIFGLSNFGRREGMP